MTTLQMEIALAKHFNFRTNLIVPNISWGMGLHECDLLILTPAGYACEIEIKVNKYDLIKDNQKTHGHYSHKIKFLYFAIPKYLVEYKKYIPERAGIIIVTERNYDDPICEILRKPKINSNYKFSDEEKYNVARLGAMRIWRLKGK